MVFVLRCWAMKYVVKSNFYWSEFKSSHSLINFPHSSFLSYFLLFTVSELRFFPISEIKCSLTFFLHSLQVWLRNLISYNYSLLYMHGSDIRNVFLFHMRKEMVRFVSISRAKKILFNACYYKVRKIFLHWPSFEWRLVFPLFKLGWFIVRDDIKLLSGRGREIFRVCTAPFK